MDNIMNVYLIYETDDCGAMGNMGYIPSHPLCLGEIPAQSDHEMLAWARQRKWEDLPQDIQDRGDAVPLVKFVRGMFLDEDFDNRTELTSEERMRRVKKEEWEFMQGKIDDAAVIHITTEDDLWEVMDKTGRIMEEHFPDKDIEQFRKSYKEARAQGWFKQINFAVVDSEAHPMNSKPK